MVSVGVLALAFEAGRRYPFAGFERPTSRPPPVWRQLAAAPFPRYEAASAVLGGRLYVFGGFLNWPDGDATASVDLYDPGTNSWSRRREMPRPITHRQAAVNGDTAWFAGGFVGKSPGPATDEVWAYSAATDHWVEAPKLPSPRAAGALVWHQGRLHYYGGFGPDRRTPLSDHLVLDLAEVDRGEGQAQWRRAAPLPEPRGHLAGAAVDSFLYALGGTVRHDPYQASRDAVHRYDPATDSWSSVASLPTPRSHFEASIAIHRGRIVIAGGWDLTADPRDVADVSTYDPQADEWTTVLRLPQRRLAPVSGVIGDTLIAGLGGKDLVGPQDRSLWMHRLSPGWLVGDSMPVALGEAVGGIIAEQLLMLGRGPRQTLALDLRSGRWLPTERYARRPALNSGHAAEVVDGKLYLLGGYGRSATLVQVFDPLSNQWSYGPDMPFQAGASASAVIGGHIYVVGGTVGDTVTGSAAKFDPRRGIWSSIAAMPVPRSHAGYGTDGVKLYVFGGRGPTGGAAAQGADDVLVYDPVTNTWTGSRTGPLSPAPLPQGRRGLGKAVFTGGKFWVFGGEALDAPDATRDGILDRIDIYDPVVNRWASGPKLPTARHGILAVLHDGYIYLLGGARVGRPRSSVVEILRLPTGPERSGRGEDPPPRDP